LKIQLPAFSKLYFFSKTH